MTQGREEEAAASLRKLRNSNIDEGEFQAELNEIRGSTRQQSEQNKKQLFIEMWRGTNRRRSLLSIAIICFHCANGSSWINIYTTYFLTIAGVENAFSYSVMVTCMGLLGVLFSATFIRYVDRRIVVLVGVAACGLCQLSFAVAWSVAPGAEATGKAVVAFISLFTFFYVAYGKFILILKWFPTDLSAPYAWLLGGEFPNNALRAYTFGFGTALNFLGNWLGTFTAPYFINPASLGWSAKVSSPPARSFQYGLICKSMDTFGSDLI